MTTAIKLRQLLFAAAARSVATSSRKTNKSRRANLPPVLYGKSSRELSKDCPGMRRFDWRDLIGKLGQHWVFSPDFPALISP
jgi:hypothetical protein